MSDSFTFRGATYTLREHKQLVQVAGPWPSGRKLFARGCRIVGGEEVHETAAQMHSRVEELARKRDDEVSFPIDAHYFASTQTR